MDEHGDEEAEHEETGKAPTITSPHKLEELDSCESDEECIDMSRSISFWNAKVDSGEASVVVSTTVGQADGDRIDTLRMWWLGEEVMVLQFIVLVSVSACWYYLHVMMWCTLMKDIEFDL